MRILVTLALIALLGCKNEALQSKGETSASAAVDVAYEKAANVHRVAAAPQASSVADNRMIIRTANLSMIVADTSAAIDKITAATEGAGGYVSDSKVWREGELLRGSMSLRVPAAQLTAALAAIRKTAVRIQSESLSSQEVTQEFVDLESQLRNLEATEQELRALMTLVRERARKASEVLEMHQQLQTIRGQIEQIKGRMRYLDQMSAFATMQLDLIPDAIAQPVVQPGWQPLVVAKDAGRALVQLLQSVANVAIWLAIYVLPIMTLLALAALVAWRVAGRAIRHRIDAM